MSIVLELANVHINKAELIGHCYLFKCPQKRIKLLEGFVVGELCPPNPPLGIRPKPRFGSVSMNAFLLINALEIMLDNRKRNKQFASCSIWKGIF